MRYHYHKLDSEGWTEAIHPNMTSYKMKCCDCALIHEIKFSVVEVGRVRKDGTFTIHGPGKKNYRVQMKVRRDKRATAGARRKRIA